MPVDAFASIRLSESRDIFATLTPASGTATINSGTVTLYDASGLVAGGVSAAPVTGNTSGAAAAPQAWYRLRPSVLTILPGTYVLSFLLSFTGPNGADVDEVCVGVVVTGDAG